LLCSSDILLVLLQNGLGGFFGGFAGLGLDLLGLLCRRVGGYCGGSCTVLGDMKIAIKINPE
jgi:hypothetical protein